MSKKRNYEEEHREIKLHWEEELFSYRTVEL